MIRISSTCMADRLQLVALALSANCAPESLPVPVSEFIAACWPGTRRAQLLDRARRLALRASLRVRPEPGPGGVRPYALVLVIGDARAELIAHVRRLAGRGGSRRAKAPLPPAREARQRGFYEAEPDNRVIASLRTHFLPRSTNLGSGLEREAGRAGGFAGEPHDALWRRFDLQNRNRVVHEERAAHRRFHGSRLHRGPIGRDQSGKYRDRLAVNDAVNAL